MTSRVSLAPELETDRAEDLAPAIEMVCALRQAHIELGEDVVVVGDGPQAHLAAELARIAGAADVRRVDAAALDEAESKSADVLIVASDDRRALAGSLRFVRNLGRVLLLANVGAADFDVYPDLHKRSIRLIGVKPEADVSEGAAEFVKHLVESGQLELDSP
jgi:threonine dehydrogenase-like Zn-dependent dehydrogenase